MAVESEEHKIDEEKIKEAVRLFLEGIGEDAEFFARMGREQSIRLNEKGTVVLHYVRGAGAIADKHDRWNRILHNAQFQTILANLKMVEKDRIFCRHDLTHLLDTARIMHILNLEEGKLLPKDIVYAAGLLHDIGRLRQYTDGVSHDEAGIPIAKEILGDCDYTEEEQEIVLFAISAHRDTHEDTQSVEHQKDQLADILYRADKGGRMCFQCDAWAECNWPIERKNKELLH